MIFAAATLAVGLASPAHAQIYSWRDTDVRLILSNSKPHGADSVQTFAVPETEGVRTTRNAVAIDRMQAYDDLIVEHSRLNGARPSLVRAVVQVESGFNPRASSPKGAMGLMQLMPATAASLGVRDAFDPADNVDGGSRHLASLLASYGGDLKKALAAYNAGAGAVARHGGVPPYRETREYIDKVLMRYRSGS
jgi:soluble lytic murein transglycosylase-like protein